MSVPELFRRLRRLRREGGPETPGRPSPGLPPALRRWLGRRRGRAEERGPFPRETAPPGGLVEATSPLGCFAFRETRLPASHIHGLWRLDEVFQVEGEPYPLLTRDRALSDLDPRRCLFFDTETTGLHCGAGTKVFMIGLGRFEQDGFRVWQGFLRDPGEEPALLGEAARRIRGVLVSFFGKAFDRHRLGDRMRIAGIEPPFAGIPHLDLYHPLRLLTGGSLPDGRLRTLEQGLCGVVRPSDLPGSAAPEAWWDFLAGRPHRLEGVFRHNLDDILSLVVLTAWLGHVLKEVRSGGRPLGGCPLRRAQGIGKAFLRRRQPERAAPWLARCSGLAPVLHDREGEGGSAVSPSLESIS